MKKNIAILFFSLCLLFSPLAIFAKTDLSIAATDITFSKTEILAGDVVRIYARIFNKGDIDQDGQITFTANHEKIGAAQQISIRPGTYDDVFVDWKPVKGTYTISVAIIGAEPADNNPANNTVTVKALTVEPDANQNGIADTKEVKPAAATESSKTQPIAAQESQTALPQNNSTVETVKNTIQQVATSAVAAAEPVYQKAAEAVKNTAGDKVNIANVLRQPAGLLEMAKDFYANHKGLSWIGLGIFLLLLFGFFIRRFFQEV